MSEELKDKVINHVVNHSKWDTSDKPERYSVTWKGYIFRSNDTFDLVTKILEFEKDIGGR
jgi:hypothetical protein